MSSRLLTDDRTTYYRQFWCFCFSIRKRRRQWSKPYCWSRTDLLASFKFLYCLYLRELISVRQFFLFPFFLFYLLLARYQWLIPVYVLFGGMTCEATSMQRDKMGKRPSRQPFCSRCKYIMFPQSWNLRTLVYQISLIILFIFGMLVFLLYFSNL